MIALAGSVNNLRVFVDSAGHDLYEGRTFSLAFELKLFTSLHIHVNHVITALHSSYLSKIGLIVEV